MVWGRGELNYHRNNTFPEERNGVGEGGVKLSQEQHFPRGKKWCGGGGS